MIQPGALGDAILLADDPLVDISVLAESRIERVIQGGIPV
ncbi:hypothetical protein GCM10022198_11090 [Klugiella xanthotipulae]